MKSYAQRFAENLRKLRQSMNMTQRELAEAVKYSEKTVSKWETNASVPEIGALFTIASVLHTDIEGLFRDDDESWLLGIDGGGTKTALALADSTGNIIRTLKTDCCNPIDIGLDASCAILSDAIYELCRGIPLSQVTLYAGIAGGTSGDMRKQLAEFFESFGFDSFDNGSDNMNIITAGLGDGDGVSLILGTGICAWAKRGSDIKRIAGWGYLIDDGGSAYNIGRDALSAYYRAYDGSGEPTLLTEYIDQSEQSPEQLLGDIYAGGKKIIAGYSQLVFRAADEGDRVSESILERNFSFAANIIETAAKDFDNSKRLKVVLAGGLTEQPTLMPRLNTALSNADNYDLRVLDCEPVVGAIKCAMKLHSRKK